MKLHLVRSTDTKLSPECALCGLSVEPTHKFFLSDAPVEHRAFFHYSCGQKVLRQELASVDDR